MSRVLVPLAQGCEELEAVTIINVLRRAGAEVVAASLSEGPVVCARGTRLLADATLEEALKSDYDLIALPGGKPGTSNLKADSRLLEALRRQRAQGRLSAALCAAPSVLAEAGLLKGKRATSYPGALDPYKAGLTLVEEPVVEDGDVVTSRSAGTAMDFALKLVEKLFGTDKRKEVEAALMRAS